MPGLAAVAETSTGSVENIKLLAEGQVEFRPVPVRHRLLGLFRQRHVQTRNSPQSNLRAIANLYQESLQIVVRAEFADPEDCRSEGPAGVIGRTRLGRAGDGVGGDRGLWPDAAQLQAPAAVDRRCRSGSCRPARWMRSSSSAATACPSIVQLAETIPVRLLPVDGAEAQALRQANPVPDPRHHSHRQLPQRGGGGHAGDRHLLAGARQPERRPWPMS